MDEELPVVVVVEAGVGAFPVVLVLEEDDFFPVVEVLALGPVVLVLALAPVVLVEVDEATLPEAATVPAT